MGACALVTRVSTALGGAGEAVCRGQTGFMAVTRGDRENSTGPKNAHLGVGRFGGLRDGAGGALQGHGVQPAELKGDASPGQDGAAFDADEQQREPAQ